jgi:hypothetical protein
MLKYRYNSIGIRGKESAMHCNRRGILNALLICLGLMIVLPVWAKDEPPEEKQKKNFRVTPFIAPGYTPELGFVIAGGGLFSFSTNQANEALPRSSVNLAFSYGETGSLSFSTLMNTYWLADRLRVSADIWIKDMPDNYWGVGYDKARNTKKGENTTAYDRFWWQIYPRVLWQFRKGTFAGLGLDFNQTVASNLSAGVAADPDIQEQGTDNYNGGMGLIFVHDSRDVPVNAYKGWYLSGSAISYGRYLGSDNKYQVYAIDYRHYRQIVRPGSTLAWQVYTRYCTGDVPWAELTQVGNPFNLRGYYWGHYRDAAGTFAILEYRYKFMTERQSRFRPEEGKKESRHGPVAWVGLGAIGPGYGEQWGNWMPNGGFGYRFEVQPRMNARIDFGWGYESFGVYFNFTEAF